jgi:hypothetical protein
MSKNHKKFVSCLKKNTCPRVVGTDNPVSGITGVEKNNPQINSHIQVRGNAWK